WRPWLSSYAATVAEEVSVLGRQLFAVVDDQHLGRVAFLFQFQTEFLDRRKHCRSRSSGFDLRQQSPLEPGVEGAGEPGAVHDRPLAEVCWRQGGELASELLHGHVVTIGSG